MGLQHELTACRNLDLARNFRTLIHREDFSIGLSGLSDDFRKFFWCILGRMPPAAERLLIITGSMGSGKTTVLGEASDILALRGIPHAAIDLDALGIAHLPPGTSNHGLTYHNLKSVWENYAACGLSHLLLAGAVEDRAELERCRGAVSAGKTVICRLTASIETMQQRVRGREPGTLQQKYVARVAELEVVLDRSRVENFSIANENRSVSDVAHEMLARAGWLEPQ
jgi:adenylylsulfate kinase